MENVSEALMIAGGVLLAVILVALLVQTINNVSIIPQEEKSQEEVERLQKWNAEWEAYNKKLLYASEVLTVINKAEQNDIDNEGEDEYKVIVKVVDSENKNIARNDISTSSIFMCKKITYNNGRASEIVFSLIK